MSLEKDIAMMVMLKKVKEMNMVNVVQNKDSFYQMLNTELEYWQQKLQQHIGTHYVPNYISSIPATENPLILTFPLLFFCSFYYSFC